MIQKISATLIVALLSILQIGRQAGFNDPDNLKRLFRKRFGVPMREWRKASRR